MLKLERWVENDFCALVTDGCFFCALFYGKNIIQKEECKMKMVESLLKGREKIYVQVKNKETAESFLREA